MTQKDLRLNNYLRIRTKYTFISVLVHWRSLKLNCKSVCLLITTVLPDIDIKNKYHNIESNCVFMLFALV